MHDARALLLFLHVLLPKGSDTHVAGHSKQSSRRRGEIVWNFGDESATSLLSPNIHA